jgi:nicotinamidase-related amidase
MLMDATRSLCLVVDVQARLAPAIREVDAVVAVVRQLLQVCERLAVPVQLVEENPRALGATVPAVASACAHAGPAMPKMTFSCMREPEIGERLAGFERNQVIVCGTETHVCVLQSALGVLAAGYDVFVVADGCGTRYRADHERALQRLERAGCTIVTAEMVVFEWLERAGTDAFRDVIPSVRDRPR